MVMEELFPPGSKVTFVDAPCGDMTWIPLLLNELIAQSGYRIDYLGLDIVEDLILENSASVDNTPGLSCRFTQRDLTEVSPPQGDIIFCKDLINHLSFDDIRRVLVRFNESGSGYLLITSNRGHRNLDVKVMRGNASRHINLEGYPFLLSPPLWSNGYLALWELPIHLSNNHKQRFTPEGAP